MKNNPDKSGNPFFEYSVTGFYFQNAIRTFTHTLNDYSSYSIVSLDGCPPVGAKSPLNFFGKLNQEELDRLEISLQNHKQHNHTFVIGHYPLSTILSDTSSR